MKWIIRKDIKVDRVACPWLIKRFVDPKAEFLFVEETGLVEQAKLQGQLTEAIGQGSLQTLFDSRSSMHGKRLAGLVGLIS